MGRGIFRFLFVINLLFINLTFATEFITPETLQHSNVVIYNKLLSAEEASEQLHQNGNLKPFLNEVRPVIEAVPDLINFFGFRLLHNHFTLENGEVMLETCEEFEGNKPALVTSPTEFNREEHYPASWIFNNNHIYTFEYSTDQSVKEGLKILSSALSVISRISELEYKYNLQSLLAPALIARKNYQSASKDAIFVERTQTEPTFRSIVTLEHLNVHEKKDFVLTSWAANPDLVTLGCLKEWGCQPMPNFSHITVYKGHRVTK